MTNLNDCGCCEGLTPQTPVEIFNRPGLDAIAYRVGTQVQFKHSLLASLTTSEAELSKLLELHSRENDDFSIAFLDAWATVADVLTFYQERIANESYLRTATERQSLLYLARLIGYKARPGVAASTYLAFTLEDAPGSPRKVPIDVGTKVQSLPEPGEKPQTFETVEKIEANAEWNAIKPQLTKTQTISTIMSSVLLQGTGTNLKAGDYLLIVTASDKKVRRILSVEVNNAAGVTRVYLEPLPTQTDVIAAQVSIFNQAVLPAAFVSIASKQVLSQWELESFAFVQGYSISEVAATIASAYIKVEATDTGVFAFRTRASLFGHNAPKWDSLPTNQRKPEWIIQRDNDGNFVKFERVDPAYPNSWEGRTLAQDTGNTKQVYLDNTYSSIIKGSWLVLQSPSTQEIYQVNDSTELSRSDFAITAKVTRLTLDSAKNFNQFTLRGTTVFTQSQKLALALEPVTEPVENNVIKLDKRYDGLRSGQAIAISGIRADFSQEQYSEIAIVSNFQFNSAEQRTIIILTKSLTYPLKRNTVTINANVTLATHGETKEEVLGSGDATQPYQRFALRFLPLTYVSSPTSPTGAESTLKVRVNDLLWHEVPTLYGHDLKDRVFVTRTDDDGKTTIEFGDGKTGARLPTGQENIKATYRQGIGTEGLVKAGQLNLLMTRPLGVKSVVNPLAATGAENPESLSQVRRNAPLTVLTLDRLVSLQDYEDFARAFAGIAKALATWTWNGQVRGVFVTIAGANGAQVKPDSQVYKNLVAAMHSYGDPYVPLQVQSYRPAFFRITAKVKVDPDYQEERVVAEVKQVLYSRFSFDTRAFGQPVALSEIMAIIQPVPGVLAVDVDYLYRSREDGTFPTPDLLPRLPAAAPQAGTDTVFAAELLTLASDSADIRTMRRSREWGL
ncbi:putative baseplate assembly protein [Scytonema sp. PRP1]|uniref:putative baseplate assembly protein n=1 Tax=Scytonema sp. PRP1 TaxID=3120513 RepID=UPI00300C8B89